jgi:hypothetical protein
MKLRRIVHGPRDRLHRGTTRRSRRSLHRYVRSAAARWNESRTTLSLVLEALAISKAQKRMARAMKTRSYRRRVDRILTHARRIGGRIVHDGRSPYGRVVPTGTELRP